MEVVRIDGLWTLLVLYLTPRSFLFVFLFVCFFLFFFYNQPSGLLRVPSFNGRKERRNRDRGTSVSFVVVVVVVVVVVCASLVLKGISYLFFFLFPLTRVSISKFPTSASAAHLSLARW